MLGFGVRGPGRAAKEGRVLPEVVYGEETLKTQDGIELFCRVWLPGGPGRVEGFGGYLPRSR